MRSPRAPLPLRKGGPDAGFRRGWNTQPHGVRRPGRTQVRRRLLVLLIVAVAGVGGLPILAWHSAASSAATTPPGGTFVRVDGLRLHAMCAGAGRAILMIHGNPGSVYSWQGAMWARLARHHRVYAVDRPGHGFSERGVGVLDTVEGQVRIRRDAARSLGFHRPVVVGHSWGGGAALAYGLTFPAEVAGLVLLNGRAFPFEGDFVDGLEKIVAIPGVGSGVTHVLGSLLAEHVLAGELETSFAPDPVPQAYRALAIPLWSRPDNLRAISFDDAALKRSLPAMAERYGGMRLPTVIVVGDADRVIDPARHGLKLGGVIPGARLLTIRGAGHEVFQTRPEQVARAIATLRDRVR